jgi:hypothetical protein
MSIVLDRSEFFTLATLLRADQIFGLDAAKIVPDSPQAAQALYDQGRESLRARELIRTNERNEVELEQGLRNLMETVVSPENALLAVRVTPGLGRQLFLYYERGHRFVEQTLPDETTHQLGTLDSHEALIERLLQIFPLTEATTPDDGFTIGTRELLEAYQLAGAGQRAQALALLERAQSSNEALAQQLGRAFTEAEFTGNISLIKIVPGQTTNSHDIALAQNVDGAWGITATRDDNVMRVERINADVLRSTLRQGLLAMDQPVG